MILIFSHAHPSISKGGAEVSAYTLYKGLLNLGYEAAFVAMCPDKDSTKVQFSTLNERVVAYSPQGYDHFFHFADQGLVEQIVETIEEFDPDKIIFHHFLFSGINTLRNVNERFAVPTVLVLHEFLVLCHHHGQMVTRPQKKLCSKSTPLSCAQCFPEHFPEEFYIRADYFRHTVSELHAIVSPSKFLAERFIAWGVNEGKIFVIENGLMGFVPDKKPVDKEAHGTLGVSGRSGFLIDARRNQVQEKKSAKPVVFGYFGQINPFKGIDQVLDALDVICKSGDWSGTILVRVHGNLIGVTDEFRVRFEAATKIGGLVEYVGPYQNSDVHNLMSACDYILMASTWWENSPVVIQEAYAARRPVIVPGFGGMAEKVVDGVGGYHFMPNSPEDLARIIISCSKPAKKFDHSVLPVPLTAEQMAAEYMRLFS